MRQIGDPFRVMLPLFLRDQDRIRNEIIDIAGAHRPGIAEIIDLNRRRSHGEDAWPAVLRESFKVDGYVKFKAPRQQRNILIGQSADLYETVKCFLQSSPHLISCERTK